MKISRFIKLLPAVILFFCCFESYGFVINMDFENGTKGAKVMDTSCKLNGGDVFSSDANGTFFTDEESYGGSGQSAVLNINQGATGFGAWGGVVDFKKCFGGV